MKKITRHEEFSKSLTLAQKEFLERCCKENLDRAERILHIYKIVKKANSDSHNKKLTWMTYNMKEMINKAEVYWQLMSGKEDERYENLLEFATEL